MDYKEYKEIVKKRGYTMLNIDNHVMLEKKIGDKVNQIRFSTNSKINLHVSFAKYDPDVFYATLKFLGMAKGCKEDQLTLKEYNTEDLIGLDYIEFEKHELPKKQRYRNEGYYNLEDTLNDVFLMWLIKLMKAKERKASLKL